MVSFLFNIEINFQYDKTCKKLKYCKLIFIWSKDFSLYQDVDIKTFKNLI